MIRAKPVGRGAEYSIGFATSRRSCARRTSRCHQAVAYGAGTTAINLLPLRIKSRNKLFSSSHLAPSSARRNQIYASGLALRCGAKFVITVNATLKTAVAISIVIAGAIVIYEVL